MNNNLVIGAMVLAIVGVVGVLGAGLINMVRGRDDVISGKRANKLMWWRVYLQGAAIALFALVMYLIKG